MPTNRTRRPLLWGLLITAVASTLTHGTASVRADDTRSLPTMVAGQGGAGQPTPLPYFWNETNDAQIHMFMYPQLQAINPQRTASQAYCIGFPAAGAVAVRALD